MKKYIAVLMILIMFVSALPFGAGAQVASDNNAFCKENPNNEFVNFGKGNINLGQTNPDNVKVISSVNDYLELKGTNEQGKNDIATTGASTLPDFVDNSQSPYFPEIGSQGTQGSCVAWACAYYQFTYQMNKALGITTTKDNTFSPAWPYNFLSRGTDSGTNFALVYGILKQHGCPTLKSVPYNEKDYLSWSTDEKVWREAIRYRLEDYQIFDKIGEDGKDITSPDDPDLLAIKTALSNGDVLTCSTFFDSWETKTLKTNAAAPENNKYVNQKYLRAMTSTKGDHRITIVGYNDNLWCDINNNNAIDDGEMGALKIANSWGKTYGNQGYLWVSYDSLNTVSCVKDVTDVSTRKRALIEFTRIDVKPVKAQDIYVKFTVNTANRSKFYAIFNASLNGSEFQRYILDSATYYGNDDNYAFNGTKNACDATFVYALSDVSPTLTKDNFEDHDFSITIKDGVSDSSTVVVKNVSLVNEYTGKEYKVNSNLPVTLNKSEWNATLKENTTKNAVVYYIGFDEPNLHYKKSGNTFTKVKMEKNDERHGYLYKYVVEDITSDIAIYFSDDKGNVDNNNGNYYYAKDGLNYYFTKGQHDELVISNLKVANGIPDITKRCTLSFDTTGGYEPYQYKYTLEDLSTGEVKTINYNVKYDNNPFKYTKETSYKITVEVMDYAKQTAQTSIVVKVEDQPFVIKEIAQSRTNGLVSKEMTFSSITEFEGLLSGPHKPESRFVIKDSDGKIWFDQVIRFTSSNYHLNSTTTHCNFTPQKAGKYTLHVSSTDYYKETAEKTISFEVFDMIYGDSDGNGEVSVMDATTVQRYLADVITDESICLDFADCDENEDVNVLDATLIQRYVASLNGSANVGKVIEYTPNVEPSDPTVEPTTPTVAPTTPPAPGNKVTFTNSLNWSGTIYCYYWSDSNTQMTAWPGKAMTKSGTNEYSETLYTFSVPNGVKYIIFTNGSAQTVDITYPGGEVKYYPMSSKTGNGHNVGTW